MIPNPYSHLSTHFTTHADFPPEKIIFRKKNNFDRILIFQSTGVSNGTWRISSGIYDCHPILREQKQFSNMNDGLANADWQFRYPPYRGRCPPLTNDDVTDEIFTLGMPRLEVVVVVIGRLFSRLIDDMLSLTCYSRYWVVHWRVGTPCTCIPQPIDRDFTRPDSRQLWQTIDDSRSQGCQIPAYRVVKFWYMMKFFNIRTKSIYLRMYHKFFSIPHAY